MDVLYGTLCYLCIDGKTLMIHKKVREGDPNSGFYTLPGGKLKDSERGSEEGRLIGVVREFLEETGLEISDLEFKGQILFDNSEREFPNWPNPKNFLVYIFAARIYSGELIDGSHEGIPRWVEEKGINNLPQNPGDYKIFEWLKKYEKPFDGVIKHKGLVLDEERTSVKDLEI